MLGDVLRFVTIGLEGGCILAFLGAFALSSLGDAVDEYNGDDDYN